MADKIFRWLSWCVLSAATVGIITVFAWLNWPYKTLEVLEVKVMNSPVAAGGYVEIYLDSIKHINRKAKVLRCLYNDFGFQYPPTDTDAPVGRHDRVLRFKVPDFAPSGTDYVFRTTYIYRVNLIKEIQVSWETPRFTVQGRQ